MLAVDFLLTHIVPEDSMDDGGINELLFGKRPLWHIVVISAVVAVCEELLFRGQSSIPLGRTGQVYCLPLFMSVICGTGFQRAGSSSAAMVLGLFTSIRAVCGHLYCAISL